MTGPAEKKWLLYGANGYTGRLIAEHAAERGLKPVLAGRNRAALEELAARWGNAIDVFELQSPQQVAEHLQGAAAVLNCAGPFSRTARVMMEACLIAGTNYLDITGEIGVIETAAALDERAQQVGVAILPAVGFDVVPSDCLAAMLGQRLPTAERLVLAFSGTGGLSHGTATTMLENLPHGGMARTGGKLVRVPAAWKMMQIPFATGRKWAMTIPWGDVASAYYSTGIPNIEVYMAMPRSYIKRLRRLRFLLPLFKLKLLHNVAQKYIDRKITGPSAEERTRERVSFFGLVKGPAGSSACATLETPSGYVLTVLTATAAVEKVLAGSVRPGFSTPSQAFGSQFILTIPGVELRWLDDCTVLEE